MGSLKSVVRQMQMLVVAAVAVLSSACAKHDVTSPLLDVSLSVSSGGRFAFEVQQTLQLTATVRDSSGAALAGQTVVWSSSDSTVATVSNVGTVTGKSPGSVIITAACDGTEAQTTLTVAPPVAQVSVVQEQPGSLAIGGTTNVSTLVLDANGKTINGLPVTWSSSNVSVATVVPLNTFVAVVTSGASAGPVSITATVGGISGSATVAVVPLSAVAAIVVRPATITYVGGPTGFGAATQISLTATDVNGSAVFGVSATWSVANTAAATVSTAGLLTPNAAVLNGSSLADTVTATVAGLSATIPVLVCPAVQSITASTTAISLAVGQSVVISATALDAHGNVDLAPLETQIMWSGEKPIEVQRAGFDSLLVTAVAAGTGSLDVRDATSGVHSQTIAVTVAGSKPEP
jgi:hypothetical protein